MIAIVTIIIELVMLCIAHAIGADEGISDVAATGLIVVFSVSLMVSLSSGSRLSRYAAQLMLGYLARLAILYFDLFGSSIMTLPQSGADSAMFYRTSRELALYGQTNRSGMFITLMGSVFRLIGTNHLYGQFLLVLLSVAALAICLRTIDGLNLEEEDKTRFAWIICLLPNFALLSSLFLRESMVMLLVTISACAMLRWMNQGSPLYVLMAVLSSMAACLFHSGSIGITIGCVLCLLAYDAREKRIHISGSGFMLAIILAVAVSFVFLRYGDALMEKFSDVSGMEDIANTYSGQAGSSYLRYVGNSNSLLNFVIYSPLRIVYFLFSPFPWQWRGLGDIIAFFFSGLYYLVVLKRVISCLRDRNHPRRAMVLGLLPMAFFCTFIFAWGTSNTGTASRHRDKMVCLYGLLYVLSGPVTDTVPESCSSRYIKA